MCVCVDRQVNRYIAIDIDRWIDEKTDKDKDMNINRQIIWQIDTYTHRWIDKQTQWEPDALQLRALLVFPKDAFMSAAIASPVLRVNVKILITGSDP